MSAVINQHNLHFRNAETTDIPAIMSVEEQVYKFPWTKRIFADCIRVGYSCELAEMDDELVAYAIMSMGANEAHLLNLCVSPHWQGQGIGCDMLQHMLDLAGENWVETVFLEVRPSNQVAVALYDKLGFNIIGTRKDYYPADNGREDAIILARTLIR